MPYLQTEIDDWILAKVLLKQLLILCLNLGAFEKLVLMFLIVRMDRDRKVVSEHGEIGGLSKPSWPHNKRDTCGVFNDIFYKECLVYKGEAIIHYFLEITVSKWNISTSIYCYIIVCDKINVDQFSTQQGKQESTMHRPVKIC